MPSWEEFDPGRPIDDGLMEIVLYTARTGSYLHEWELLLPLLSALIELRVLEFTKREPDLTADTVDALNEDKGCILRALASHRHAPFTIQRLCEILAHPSRFYRTTYKLLGCLEKLATVSTTQDADPPPTDGVVTLPPEREPVEVVKPPHRVISGAACLGPSPLAAMFASVQPGGPGAFMGIEFGAYVPPGSLLAGTGGSSSPLGVPTSAAAAAGAAEAAHEGLVAVSSPGGTPASGGVEHLMPVVAAGVPGVDLSTPMASMFQASPPAALLSTLDDPMGGPSE